MEEHVNTYYVQSSTPNPALESEIERVEGGYGLKPRDHFLAIRSVIPQLAGIAILDNDGKNPEDSIEGGLRTHYWQRCECENYFVTPDLLREFAMQEYSDAPLFQQIVPSVLDELILERVFQGHAREFKTWKGLSSDGSHLLWESRTKDVKLSDFAEEFFRRLSERLNQAMLLRKADLHQLVERADVGLISDEVREKLDLLGELLSSQTQDEGPSLP